MQIILGVGTLILVGCLILLFIIIVSNKDIK